MKEKLQELAARFEALMPRERATIAVAVLGGGLLIGYLMLIDPQISREATQIKRVSQINGDLATLDAEMAMLQAQLKDPNAGNRAALEEVRKRMATIDLRLRNLQESLVMPDKMQTFLQGLLSKHGKLELLSLRTLPAAPLIEQPPGKDGAKVPTNTPTNAKPADGSVKPTANTADQAANIYKHALEIRIAGNYGDLLKYLSEVEGMPQRIIWGQAELTVEKYPRCVLKLTVYTLSLDTQWLIV